MQIYKKRVSLIALIIICAMLITMLAIMPMQANAATYSEYVAMSGYELHDMLEITIAEDIYDGITEDVYYSEYPSNDMQFLLINLTISPWTGGSIDASSITVNYGDNEYMRKASDIFLLTYGYNTLNNGNIIVASSGWIAVEVPDSITEAQLLNATLSIEGVAEISFMQAVDSENLISQVAYNGYTEYQEKLEEYYITIFNAGTYTVADPYIIVNPYEIAPQSAIIMFTTDEAVSVTTSIIGKEPNIEMTTITNTIEEYTTYHEVPLIGLYSGESTVVLTTTNEQGETSNYTYYIESSSLNEISNLTDRFEATVCDATQLSEGLYLIKDLYRTLVDINGDVRGYIVLPVLDISGADEVTDEGHMIISANAFTTDARSILEIDFMGYVYLEVEQDSYLIDHDACYIDDNTILFEDSYLDLTTGEMSVYVDWSTIFDLSDGSAEVRSYGSTSDPLHFNTITTADEEGYIRVSMRNQHAVAKIAYPSMEVVWVLSVNDSAVVDEYSDCYLTPTGDDFEWFYSQHDVNFIGYNADGTYDIMIFDNGVQRGLDPDADYPDDELYSRMVVYTIDEENMTVTQKWSYGEDEGAYLLSAICGSARYIAESNTYLGCFDTSRSYSSNGVSDSYRSNSKIVEVNEAGDVVFEITRLSYGWIYRAEKVTTGLLYSSWSGFDSTEGVYYYIGEGITEYTSNYTIQDEEAIYDINSLSATQNYLEIQNHLKIK